MAVVNTVRAEPVGSPKQAAAVGHLVVKGPSTLLEKAATVPSVTLSHIEAAEGPVNISDAEIADMREAMGDSLMHVTVVGTDAALRALSESDTPDRMRDVFDQSIGATDKAVVWSGKIPSLRSGQTTFGIAMRYGHAVTLLPAVWGPGMSLIKGLDTAGGGGGVYYHPVCSGSRPIGEVVWQYVLYVGLAALAVLLAIIAVRRQDAHRKMMKQQRKVAKQKARPTDQGTLYGETLSIPNQQSVFMTSPPDVVSFP